MLVFADHAHPRINPSRLAIETISLASYNVTILCQKKIKSLRYNIITVKFNDNYAPSG